MIAFILERSFLLRQKKNRRFYSSIDSFECGAFLSFLPTFDCRSLRFFDRCCVLFLLGHEFLESLIDFFRHTAQTTMKENQRNTHSKKFLLLAYNFRINFAKNNPPRCGVKKTNSEREEKKKKKRAAREYVTNLKKKKTTPTRARITDACKTPCSATELSRFNDFI